MIRCLYAKSITCVNVNGQLTDTFNVSRGVKQGCPISSALYVIAISPLINVIKNDERIKGVTIGSEVVKISAYADDVTGFVQTAEEFYAVCEHFDMYEKVSGARLNREKSEAIWVGKEEERFPINLTVKEKI